MKVKQYKTILHQELSSFYDEKEIESFYYIIVEHLHHLKRIDLALNPDFELDKIHSKKWKLFVSELKKQKPIQYIIGETEFYGLPFLVDKNVLIPRPETEELVALIISNNQVIKSLNPLKILDIGTGSGCIPIALKKSIPDAKVFAIDISEKALAVAQKNANQNEVEITFIQENILECEYLEQQFDIIVSNPPYVRQLEKTEIKPNVLNHEPHLALFVENNDALIFYRKITELAAKSLNPKGQLCFEINQYLGKETTDLVKSFGFKNVQLFKDIYGNDRMLFATL